MLTGYPPMDLLERDGFVRDQLRELDALAAASRGVAIALGAVLPAARAAAQRAPRTRACCSRAARARRAQAKTLLPTYDVFDEKRYFVPADEREPVPSGGGAPRSGLTVCEDAWVERAAATRSIRSASWRAAGAELVLNLSARRGTWARRASGARMIARARARATACRSRS